MIILSIFLSATNVNLAHRVTKETPLHLALRFPITQQGSSVGIEQLLLRRGALTSLQDRDGNAPLPGHSMMQVVPPEQPRLRNLFASTPQDALLQRMNSIGLTFEGMNISSNTFGAVRIVEEEERRSLCEAFALRFT